MKLTISVSYVGIFIILELLSITTIISNIRFCNGSTSQGCFESERDALLRFKQHLIDPSKRLASWIPDGDCCTWAGVVCDNVTGHILELHLDNGANDEYNHHEESSLTGSITSSLLDLKHLVFLNLSGNLFEEEIPIFLGSMRSLKYLDLSKNFFVGDVPHNLGNLTYLQYLDLSSYLDLGVAQLYVENFHWLSKLSLLNYLDLSFVDLSKASDMLLVTNSFPFLKVLRLSNCGLNHDHLPYLPLANFSSLTTLDLSYNYFDGSSIPSWVFALSHLEYLDLRSTAFQGPIPNELQNLTSLRFLDLSWNDFNSSIPDVLYQLTHLESLSLSDNKLGGEISDNLGNMISIAHLDLSNNQIEGKIPKQLGNLTSITSLDLSNNKIDGKVPQTFDGLCNLRSISIPHVNLNQKISEILDILSGCVSDSLEKIDMEGSNLYGHLTHHLGQFKRLQFLRLSNNSISGLIPSSLGQLSSLEVLDFSNNKLNGTLSEVHFLNLSRLTQFDMFGNSLTLKVHRDWIPPFQLEFLSLSSSSVGPDFPVWLHSQKNLDLLDMSNCKISDSVPGWIWKPPFKLQLLDLSHNQIYGVIPNLTALTHLESLHLSSNNLSGSLPLISSNLKALEISNNSLSGSIIHFLCSAKSGSSLHMLNLANNNLSGEIPDCWTNFPNLEVLNLAENKFKGKLPDSIGTLVSLLSLHLRRNQLFGTLPVSLENCTNLMILDMSENEFSGNVPTWIGEKLLEVRIINLRSNKFHGLLPTKICRLKFLQILDLGYNNLHGRLPRCIGNFTAMVAANLSAENSITTWWESINDKQFVESEPLVLKGKKDEYDAILNLVRKIDLSKNNFSGEIPTKVTRLAALQSLNLSYNSLTGKFPENIGAMSSIEEIDISWNNLFGEIPQSISELTLLRHLNLSYNNLVGKIPSSTQLQSFEASSFTGNELCGAPLPRNCTETVPTPEKEHKEGVDEPEHEDEMLWFYVSMVFGFVVGFWVVIGPLAVSRRWRYMYYNFWDYLGHKFRDVLRKCL